MQPEETSIARQRLGKKVSEATDMHATIEAMLKTVFSTRSEQMGYKENNLSKNSSVGWEPPFTEDLSTEAED